MDSALQAKSIARRTGKFTLATLISRILGFGRDACVAYALGGEYLTDAFYTAFRTSNLLRGLLAEGAMSSSFIPVFSHALKNESKEEVQKFLSAIFTVLSFILTVVVVLGMVFARPLTHLVSPGFVDSPEKFELTVELTRWMFPFFLFICLAAFLSGVLNSLKFFFLPAVAPAMLSIAQIVYLLMARRSLTTDQLMLGLAGAVVVGGAAQFLIQVPTLWKQGYKLKLNWDWTHPHVVRVGTLIVPMIIGLSVDQINGFVDTICASYLVHGSVSALYNSNRLMQLPLALFGTSIASVSLPSMSDHAAEKSYAALRSTMNISLRIVWFTVLPASIGLIFLANPIVVLLFQHGQFTPYAAMLTTRALQGFSAGLVAYSMSKVFANVFYSLQLPKIPVKVAAACMVINIVLNLASMRALGVLGLSLSTAVASWVNSAWLYISIRNHLKSHEMPETSPDEIPLGTTILQTFIASAAMAGFLTALHFLSPQLNAAVHVLIGICGGGLVYFLSAKLLKMKEQSLILDLLGLNRD